MVATPDSLYDWMTVNNTGGWTDTLDLMNGARHHGIILRPYQFTARGALDGLMKLLDKGALIALVKYAKLKLLTGNNFLGGHFFLPVGYDDQYIYVHDPLFGWGYGTVRERGAYFKLTHDQFLAAWGGFQPAENPNYLCLAR